MSSGAKPNRKVDVHRYLGPGNSLRKWPAYKSPLRVTLNTIVITLCKYVPWLGLKNRLLRMLGMKVGKGVSIGLSVMFDVLWPENIEIGDHTIIGYGATLLGHEFLIKEWRTGKVRVGKNCSRTK